MAHNRNTESGDDYWDPEYADEQYIGAIHMWWPEDWPRLTDEQLLNFNDSQRKDLVDRIQHISEQKMLTDERSETLVHDPEERKNRSRNNLKIVLDWLRLEPYSTVQIIALVTRMGEPGARKMLNKFVRDGWLVRDEIPWEGVAGKRHLFGASSKGLYHLMEPGEVEPGPNRDFKRGRTVASSGSHILNIQLARLYLQRKDNPLGEFRRYRAARDLPNFGAKGYRWRTYPDAVIENTSYRHPINSSLGLSVAIEIEQHHKGGRRYRSIISRHMTNIDELDDENGWLSRRYDRAIYFLPSRQEANNLQQMFHVLIKNWCQHYSDNEREVANRIIDVKERFLFDTYADLPERIRAL